MFVPIWAKSRQKHFLVTKYWVNGLVGSFQNIIFMLKLSYEVTVCVALRTNHCIEMKIGFKIGLLSVYFLLQAGHFIIVHPYVFCVQQWRTTVFHFLTYHKAGKKNYHLSMMFVNGCIIQAVVTESRHSLGSILVWPCVWILLFLYLFICTFVVFSWAHSFLLILLMSRNLCVCRFVLSIQRLPCLCIKSCLFLTCVCSLLNLFRLLTILSLLVTCGGVCNAKLECEWFSVGM